MEVKIVRANFNHLDWECMEQDKTSILLVTHKVHNVVIIHVIIVVVSIHIIIVVVVIVVVVIVIVVIVIVVILREFLVTLSALLLTMRTSRDVNWLISSGILNNWFVLSINSTIFTQLPISETCTVIK